jgi:cytidylate kinase
MSVIACSQEWGSLGDRIARAVAETLGYRFADREIILEAANTYGVAEAELARLDETRPRLLERLQLERQRYLLFIEATVLRFAVEDRVVILGRGGYVLLREVSHALRVRLHAPRDARAGRVGAWAATDTKTAGQLVRQNDRERAARMRYLYEVDWTDPLLYDLAVNTARLDERTATDLIARAAGQPQFAPTSDSRRTVADLALAAQVRAALAADREVSWTSVQVTAHEGSVTIGGAVRTDAQRARVLELAGRVPGVRSVQDDVGVLPPVPWG